MHMLFGKIIFVKLKMTQFKIQSRSDNNIKSRKGRSI